ncbi:MAG: outer membrane beta-barrel protein [Bacteroidota bacterium]
MKRIFFLFSFLLLLGGLAQAQSTHTISGSIIDTTKQTVIGASVKIKTDLGDSSIRVTGLDGKFAFSNIKANKVTLTITSIGYEGIIKHFTFTNDSKPLEVGVVTLKNMSTMLGGVTIVGITPVTLKEDTTQYSAAAYKVRDNAPVEDLVKKLPGVDVDKDGNISTKGKQITKIRINGKDVFGGDVQSITKNLPADVVENIQMIDDYGDQANLTGVKTGDPNQIMNITIRKDKNYGYSANLTGGGGKDALPKPQTNDTRYVGLVNSFKFKGDQQIYLLGNFNNVNANTFSFGGTGGGGGGGFGGGGGGGRGNAARGGGGGAQAQNGLTDVHTAGLNYRDQWGKDLSVYGSYSFSDNTTNTVSTTRQSTTTPTSSSLNNQASNETDKSVNHRFTWNMEYKPDTINYLKFTPTYSYSSTQTAYADEVQQAFHSTGSDVNTHYTSTARNVAWSPNYGVNVLYNHRFNGHGRNFSVFATASSVHSDNDQNPIYHYILGVPPVPPYQQNNTGSRINSVNSNFSYLEPLSLRSFLEFNYNYNFSHTTSDKISYISNTGTSYTVDPTQSNNYSYNFLTNRFSLNYRFIEKKYNYTIGLGVQPTVLDGTNALTGVNTHHTSFNFVPTVRYIYTFSRSQSFNAQYSGNSNQPSFSQLQPVIDKSNAQYPVQGNPNLTPEFANNVNIRYNQFSFNTGDVLFLNFNYNQTSNKIVTNSITNSDATVLTKYLNADGYYSYGGFFNYTKPWDNRKFSVSLGGQANYINNIGYLTDNTVASPVMQENIAKTTTLAPNFRFRTDITDVIDATINTSYSINKTDNSIKTNLTQASSNVRAWNIGLNGKNYLWKNWTVSYDYTKTLNYGYTLAVTNPNILNVYIERRFLKNNMATIRIAGNDLFNQQTGYSLTSSATSLTETNTNRLGRYFLLTLNIRLQKFAGKAPDQGNGRGDRMPGDRGGRGDGGGRGNGGPGGGGGFGGPGGM